MSLSRYVIMQVVLACASRLSNKLFKYRLIDSWLINRAYLMRRKGKIALSTMKNNFSHSLLPFLLFHISIDICHVGAILSQEI